jgi:levanase
VLPLAYGVRAPLVRWDDPHPSRGCEVVFDFEELELPGWERSGRAFDELLAGGRRDWQRRVGRFEGLGLLSSWHRRRGPRATGEAWSPPFTIRKASLRLLVGGGDEGVSVDLMVDGAVARSATGDDRDRLERRRWDVSELRGRQARLRILDASDDKGGYVLLDQVEQCGTGS